MRTLMFALVFAAGCSGDDGDAVAKVTPCERLRAHLVDLRLATTATDKVDVVAHRRAMTRGLGDNFISGCEQTLTQSEIRCALNAGDHAAATACNTTSATNSERNH